MSRLAYLGVLGALLVAAGCVPSGQYREMKAKYLEEQAKSRRLAEENARLRKQLEALGYDTKTARDIADAIANHPGGYQFAPTTGVIPRAGGGASLEGDVFFASGKTELTPKGMAALDNLAQQLQGKPPFMLIVDGHTDTDPIRVSGHASNWELSGKRSAAVVDYLVKKGVVDPKRAVLRGFGEHKPVGPEKSKNRRVEIYAVPMTDLDMGAPAAPAAPAPAPAADPTLK